MKASETIIIVLLVGLTFVLTDMMVDNIFMISPYRRFLLRVAFQGQFIALIYLFYEIRDTVCRLNGIEKRLDEDSEERT